MGVPTKRNGDGPYSVDPRGKFLDSGVSIFPSTEFRSPMMDDDITVAASPSTASSGPSLPSDVEVVEVANDTLDPTRRHGGVNIIKGGGGGRFGSCNNDDRNDDDPMVDDDNRGVSGDVNDMNMGDADGVDEQLL